MAAPLRQPPHSVEVEQSVLGGLMLRNSAFDDVASKVSAQDFYRADHQVIFRAIAQMIASRKPCDFVTLAEHLRQHGQLDDAGGAQYLGALAIDCSGVANLLHYAGIVRERALLRSMIAVGSELADMGYAQDGRAPGELLEEIERRVQELRKANSTRGSGLRPIGDFVEAAERDIERLSKSDRKLGGISTGFPKLDAKIDGLHPGDVVIVAGRPRQGKTAFAVNVAQNVDRFERKRVAIFSMEMQGKQVALRILAGLSRVHLQRLRNGAIEGDDWNRITQAGTDVRSSLIELDETGALSPAELRSRCRRAAGREGLGLIVVDYAQLMRIPSSRENRTQQMSEIGGAFKAIAKELDVPVMALSQLTRDNDREKRRPRLSDLRDGGLEQDADVVIFVHREGNDEDGLATGVGAAEIIVGKQRQGEEGTLRMNYYGACCQFEEMSADDESRFVAGQHAKHFRPSRGFGKLRAVAGDGE